MTFTTPTFLVFLAIVYFAYWSCGRRGQNRIILIGSLIFYGWWDWRFLVLLVFVAGVDFLVAAAMARAADRRAKRRLLAASLVSNLGLLGYFKYANFLVATVGDVSAALGSPIASGRLDVVLPIGISFYTFQALSYTIDVYRGRMKPANSFVEYFCFITFFPHMVAGPIQQAVHFLGQFHCDRKFDRETSIDGLRQMLWGFFKKMVVADNLAPLVQAAYDTPNADGWTLLWATYWFALQIYCDFSGYTDIAIGCARLFDLHMTRNFACPYFATNIVDFWRRWHISLSTWFREYVYVPLGGSRHGLVRTLFNAFLVFVLSGLCHGANWTFVVWGALHGLYYCAYLLATRHRASGSGSGARPRVYDFVAAIAVFHLTAAAWVFFRAADVSQALGILARIGHAVAGGETIVAPQRSAVVWAVVLFGVEFAQRTKRHGLDIVALPRPLRWIVYYALTFGILMFARLDYVPFIYFQF